MKYDNITKAVFINRPNHFIAEVDIDGHTETVHVKNTGRCKESWRGSSVSEMPRGAGWSGYCRMNATNMGRAFNNTRLDLMYWQ